MLTWSYSYLVIVLVFANRPACSVPGAYTHLQNNTGSLVRVVSAWVAGVGNKKIYRRWGSSQRETEGRREERGTWGLWPLLASVLAAPRFNFARRTSSCRVQNNLCPFHPFFGILCLVLVIECGAFPNPRKAHPHLWSKRPVNIACS